MTRIEFAPEITDDFDRIFDHLAQFDPIEVPERVTQIIQALDILRSHPLIGRPAASDLHELVIGQGSRGYIALYRDLAELDTVLVLAIRSQREAGYRRG